MPPVARAQGQVCAQHPTTANSTRQQGLSNGGNPFQDAPHPCHDTPYPLPERPSLMGEFLGSQVVCTYRVTIPLKPCRLRMEMVSSQTAGRSGKGHFGPYGVISSDET